MELIKNRHLGNSVNLSLVSIPRNHEEDMDFWHFMWGGNMSHLYE
jgi:hypothetical protein